MVLGGCGSGGAGNGTGRLGWEGVGVMVLGERGSGGVGRAWEW